LAWQQRIHGIKKHVQITTANVDVIVPKCFCVWQIYNKSEWYNMIIIW
jgi:hypothetical protein